ncbi:MAG: CesT family type III secretion system chaperone [Chlamydiae bacterium]|nr:CesT family type III secretion system chaperone [Chlamydiota bacterium]
MTDRFTELIQELSDFLALSLHVDRNGCCLLQVHHKIGVQLQLDSSQTRLLMASLAIELPPGKFRENVLREGLKANFLPDPRPAVCSYLAQNNQLVFYQAFPLDILNGERLAGFFGAFLTEVESWVKAIESGRAAPVVSEPPLGGSGSFGLKL